MIGWTELSQVRGTSFSGGEGITPLPAISCTFCNPNGSCTDMLHGGLITMGKRVVVHTDQYDKDMQNAGSTPKELHALSVAVQMATAKFHRGAGNSRHHGGNGGCVAGGSSKMDAARVLEGEGRSVPSAWWRGCYRYRLLWMNSRSTI